MATNCSHEKKLYNATYSFLHITRDSLFPSLPTIINSIILVLES